MLVLGPAAAKAWFLCVVEQVEKEQDDDQAWYQGVTALARFYSGRRRNHKLVKAWCNNLPVPPDRSAL